MSDTSSRQFRALPPLISFIGIQFVAQENGPDLVHLPFRSELSNRKGDVHGGIVAALLDLAMSQAVRWEQAEAAGVATINLNISYLAPAKGDLTARGAVVKRGRTITFGQATIIGVDGEVAATATGTFRLIA